MTAPTFEELKAAAKSLGYGAGGIARVLALAEQNDPFYAPHTPSGRAAAEWFVRLMKDTGLIDVLGVHLRRIHYAVVSMDPPPLMPTGNQYANTKTCSQYLNMASRNARYLGLVSAESFTDQRNPDPVLNIEAKPLPEVGLEVDDLPDLPRIVADLNYDASEWNFPHMALRGTRYDDAHQPYLVGVLG